MNRYTIGRPVSSGVERALFVAIRPMLADVKATLPAVKTGADARALGVALRKRWTDARIRALVTSIGTMTERASSSLWLPLERRIARGKIKRDAAEYDGAKLIERWTREAAKKITSVRDEVAERLRRDVVAAVEAGTPPAELTARWIAEGVPVEWGTLEGRLKVIAKQQIRMLDSQVQATRAGAVGISHFEWVHSDQTVDEGARPEHVARHGLTYEYAKPPDDGLPGTQPNCNCSMVSVIPDELVAAYGLGSVFEGRRE